MGRIQMMTGNFPKATEERVSKKLKVPSSKARDLIKGMIAHGTKAGKSAKANRKPH